MYDEVTALLDSRVNVELLFDWADNGDPMFGCRVRPWANSAKAGKMVLGHGATIEDALSMAYTKAAAGQWERLDWAARPWASKKRAADGTLDV